MKKFNITVIILLALALVFTGCRGEVGEDTTTPPSVTDSPTDTTSSETTTEETTSAETTAEETTSVPETTECLHSEYVSTENMPTCTESAIIECSCVLCGYGWSETIPPIGHKYVNNVCTNCGENEFSDSEGLEFRTFPDYAVVIGIGTCKDSDVIIPATYQGLPVTEIWDRAFRDVKGMTSVTIPEGVTYIESEAFLNCPDLRAIYLPASLQNITGSLSIGFLNCPALEVIEVDAGNAKYFSKNNCLIEKATGKLVLGGGNAVIPADGSVKSIGAHAFAGNLLLKSVAIPEGVTDIYTSAFEGCTELASVSLPKTLKTVRQSAFKACTALTSVTLPDSVTEIYNGAFADCKNLKDVTLPKNLTMIDSEAFKACAIESIVIPAGVKELGAAFSECEKLKSVTLPEGFERFSGHTFAGCTALESIDLPASLNYLGFYTFYNCTSLKELRFGGTVAEWNSVYKQEKWNEDAAFVAVKCSDGIVELNEHDGSRGLEYRIDGNRAVLVGIGTCADSDIVVASTYNGVPVTEIGDGAFADCFSLETVTIPEGVKIIGNDAFNFCRSLTKVTLPSTIESIGDRAFFECVRVEEFKGSENIISIGANAFDTCNSITSIKLGNKLQKIGSEAFKSCMSLKEITVPASVTSLGEGVFAGCSSLGKAIILPKTDILGKSFFSSCGLLREVTLPDGLKEISRDAFHACASLSEIDIPESVSNIGEAAFAYCHSLQTVTLPASLTSLGMSVFQGSGIVEIVIPSGVGEIPGSAFGECNSLTKIVIPEGVTRIQNEAFYRCSKLTSISIPSSVTEIGSEAFAKSALTEIVIPDNVTWIWEAAFRECKALTSVKLGKKLELIMEAAFADCTRLESVRIPASVKEVSNGAFTGCSSLRSVTIECGIERFGTGIFVQCHDLTEIVFTGTVAEWRKIEIPERAFGHMPNEIIRCSDGDFFTHSDIPAAYRDILFGDAKFVFDSKEIRLDEFRFPSGGALITLGADVKYAVIDMDRDGLPEVVITGGVGDMLVLHEEGGKVYGFDFTFRNMDRIKNDGSFEWNDTTADGLSYGDSRLSFSKGKCTVTDICSVAGDGTDNVKYFVGGAQTTRDSYLSTADTVSKTEVEWHPLDRYSVAS